MPELRPKEDSADFKASERASIKNIDASQKIVMRTITDPWLKTGQRSENKHMSRHLKPSRLLLLLLCNVVSTAAFAVTPSLSTCAPTYNTSISDGYIASNGDSYLALAGYGGSICNAYITNYSSNTVSVIDISSNSVVGTVPVGQGPYGVALSVDGTRVYVANYASNSVSVIDTSSNQVVATVPVLTRPYGLAVSPDGTRVYVAAYFSNDLSIIDTKTNTVIGVVPVGQRPHGIVVTLDGARVYVANYTDNTISVIDPATKKAVGKIVLPANSNPMGLVLSPDSTRLYVTGYSNNKLYEIDTASNSILAAVPVGSRPWGVAVSPDQSTVYVTNYSGNADTSVSAINVADNSVTAIPLPHGVYPIGVNVHPSGQFIYVASYSDSNVYVIDRGSNTIVNTIGVGMRPYAFGAFMPPPPVSAWDHTPPVVADLLPATDTVLPVSTLPLISAHYSNPSTGIVMSSVQLTLDDVDVTAKAIVTPTGVSYKPTTLGPGYHSVTLTVADKYGLPTTATWWFITTDGPHIYNTLPSNGTVLPPGPIPKISAAYADVGDVSVGGVQLLVDGQDVTANAQINSNGVAYTPSLLPAGPHTVTLKVPDSIGLSSVAKWGFSTTSGLHVSPASPTNGQHVTDPLTNVSGTFSDSVAAIVSTNTKLTIDGIDVTAKAQILPTAINFVPVTNWTAGTHNVNLQVFDAQGTSASAAWSFIYDPAPTLYDESPRDLYVAVPNPRIRVLLKDNGTGINVTATTIAIDGHDMTAQASVSASSIVLPTSALAPGIHKVTATTVSNTGQSVSKTWQFTIITIPPPSTTADGTRTPRPVNPSIGKPL